jgi:5-methylcytosine-specific restriction endonuclease McrA
MAGADPRLSSGAWRRLRLLILDRDGWRCQIAGPHCSKFATTVDHIVARVDSGDCWAPSNLRAACRRCNSAGGADITNAMRYRTGEARYVTRL